MTKSIYDQYDPRFNRDPWAVPLDANRRRVDAHEAALERRVFEQTTGEWLAEPVDPARPGGVPKRDEYRVPDLADLDSYTLDDEGVF